MIFSDQKKASSRPITWIPIWVILLVLWLAAGLRFYQIGEQSFWNDEGNSARLSERSIPLIIEGTASDIHPPLYYLLLRGWRELLGEDEFGLRSFSAFVGVLTVAASLSLAALLFRRGAFNRKVVFLASLAAFLAAVNPALIYYSRETRMYALLALLSALSTLALIRWLNAVQRRYWSLLYIITATAGLYTHYFFPAILFLQNVIVLLWSLRYVAKLLFEPLLLKNSRSLRKSILSWLGMMALVFLLYSPWLPLFFRQTGGRAGHRDSFFAFVWDSVRWLAFGETIATGELLWPTVMIFILCIWTIVVGKGQSIIPLLGTVLPIIFMYIAGTTDAAFFKFLLIAVPFFVLLLGRGLDSPRSRINKRRYWLIIPLLLLLPILWGTAVSLGNLYNNPVYARADYRGMAGRIEEEAHSNAGIILSAPNQWEVFTYYHRAGAPVYPLPKGQPDPAILEPQLKEIAAKHERLYALFWGEDQRDPQHVVESWLDENTFKASEEWVGDVRFVVYAVPQGPAPGIDTYVNLNFGKDIILTGYALDANQLAPSDIVQVTLFWVTTRAIDKRYKVFLHLLDENGNLVAQRDGEPGGGRAITTDWQPSVTIIDNHGLLIPSDISPGSYNIVLGLYDSSDPSARLPVMVDDEVRDHLVLGAIAVK